MTWLWALGVVIAVVAGIAALQHRNTRGTYRNLASRQPARAKKMDVPLGMEAMDLDAVARTTRRNEAYERAHVNWNRGAKGSFMAASETDIEPGPDDQTYSGWFHRSFMKNKDKT